MIDVGQIKLATSLDISPWSCIMGLVMKNYTFTIRRHYEFQIEAKDFDDAVNKLNDTISEEGFDDNNCIFEDCEHSEQKGEEDEEG